MAANFELSSSSFKSQTTIPTEYTCDGNDTSPELTWSNPPENTKSFALIMSDPDAPNGTFYHWVLYNIPASTSTLAKNIKDLPKGTLAGLNSANKNSYKGPCPPPGKPHHYQFTIYALDIMLQPITDADAKAVMEAMKSHVISKTMFVGLYERK